MVNSPRENSGISTGRVIVGVGAMVLATAISGPVAVKLIRAEMAAQAAREEREDTYAQGVENMRPYCECEEGVLSGFERAEKAWRNPRGQKAMMEYPSMTEYLMLDQCVLTCAEMEAFVTAERTKYSDLARETARLQRACDCEWGEATGSKAIVDFTSTSVGEKLAKTNPGLLEHIHARNCAPQCETIQNTSPMRPVKSHR